MYLLKRLIFLPLVLLCSCNGIPEGVTVVEGFEVKRYLGTWYEIARLDHSFERGLEKVTAEYSVRQDGGIKVANKGYDPKNKRWRQAIGKAYFVQGPTVGRLKVSFFGPFYGGYNIMALDKKRYRYALVCGPDRSYLWILARGPKLDRLTKQMLIKKASDAGFKTDKLIFVKH